MTLTWPQNRAQFSRFKFCLLHLQPLLKNALPFEKPKSATGQMKKYIVALAVSLAFAFTSLSASATDQPAEKTPPTKKEKSRARSIPFNGDIAAVDKVAKTVTLEGKKQRTFQVTSQTRLSKDKKPITFDMIAIGDHVGGSYRSNPEGKDELNSMDVKTTANRPADAKEKKK
jgi:hypothetical protein